MGRDLGQSRRRGGGVRARAGWATGRARGAVEAPRGGATPRTRVESGRAASRGGGAGGLVSDRPHASVGTHDARRRVDGALERRGVRATARACPARDAIDASRASLSRNPRDASRALASAFARDVAAISPAGDAREGAAAGHDAERLVFDFLAAPGRARAGKGDGRGAHLVGPGSRGAPCGHAGSGVSVRSMRREGSVGGRADVLERDTLATAFSTHLRTSLLRQMSGAARICPAVRDSTIFTPRQFRIHAD